MRSNLLAARAKERSMGFTLIEIMIVVAIIGILAAIAMPSYSEYVKNSRRAEARAAMMEDVQYMQRFYSTNNRYDQTVAGATPTLTNTQSPTTGTASYLISLAASTNAVSFTLQAVPMGNMSTDKCGTLTITNTGIRGSSMLTPAECWK